MKPQLKLNDQELIPTLAWSNGTYMLIVSSIKNQHYLDLHLKDQTYATKFKGMCKVAILKYNQLVHLFPFHWPHFSWQALFLHSTWWSTSLSLSRLFYCIDCSIFSSLISSGIFLYLHNVLSFVPLISLLVHLLVFGTISTIEIWVHVLNP